MSGRVLMVTAVDRESGTITLSGPVEREREVVTTLDGAASGVRLGQAWKSADGVTWERDWEREARAGRLWVLVYHAGKSRCPDEVLGLFRSPAAAADSQLARRYYASSASKQWLPTEVSVSPERPIPNVPEFTWNIDGEMERLTITRFEVQG